MKDFKKVEVFSPDEKRKDSSPNKDYRFIFVGYGWNFYAGFVSEYSLDEYDPDEAFKLAVEEFRIYYPCCDAAVFYKAADDAPILYRFYTPFGADSVNVAEPGKR